MTKFKYFEYRNKYRNWYKGRMRQRYLQLNRPLYNPTWFADKRYGQLQRDLDQYDATKEVEDALYKWGQGRLPEDAMERIVEYVGYNA